MTNPLVSTKNLLAQIPTPADFNIGGEAAGKLPFIEAGNETSASYQSNFGGIISGLMSFIMAIAVLLVLLYLLWGGIEWITSGGDKGKLETARNKITQAVIGIIVLAATTGIFMFVQQFLGVQVINFEGGAQPAEAQYMCLTGEECHLLPGTISDRSHCDGCVSPNVCCRNAN